jgi:two-component system sensor kinase FixL
MAHDLNQPLTAILSNAQAAQRFLDRKHPDLDQVREILADIVEEDRRAGEVILRMRAMLKKGQAKMSPLNLNLVIGEALRLLHSELLVREVVVVTHLAPELPLVRGDRIQLQQVLLNLIMNSCDAMTVNPAPGRRVTIKTERVDSGYVQVSISDEGPGFAPDFLEQPFEGFRTSKPQGLGLGLLICQSILLAHGGGLWVANNPGRGANVRFTLAVHEKETM